MLKNQKKAIKLMCNSVTTPLLLRVKIEGHFVEPRSKILEIREVVKFPRHFLKQQGRLKNLI